MIGMVIGDNEVNTALFTVSAPSSRILNSEISLDPLVTY